MADVVVQVPVPDVKQPVDDQEKTPSSPAVAKEPASDLAPPAPSPVVQPPAAPLPKPVVPAPVLVPAIARDAMSDDDEDEDDDMDSMDEIDDHMRDADDEMMYIRKGVLDTVVIQQQKRIAELERKLIRSKQEVARLKSAGQAGRTPGALRPATVCLGNTPVVSQTKHHADVGANGTATSTVTMESIGVARQSQSIVKRPSARKLGHSMAGVAASAAVTTERAVVLEGQTRYWTADEHERFLRGVEKFGPRNYTAISTFVKSRTPKQVRTHAQKYEMRLAREAVRKSAPTTPSIPTTAKTESQVIQNTSETVPPTTVIAPKLEATLTTEKPQSQEPNDSQLLTIPGGPQFVEQEIDLLSADRPDLHESMEEDVANVVSDRALLHSFDRSFSKSDLKSLGNDEDQWLDI